MTKSWIYLNSITQTVRLQEKTRGFRTMAFFEQGRTTYRVMLQIRNIGTDHCKPGKGMPYWPGEVLSRS